MNRFGLGCLIGAVFALVLPATAPAAGPSGQVSQVVNTSATTARVYATVTGGSTSNPSYHVSYALASSEWCTSGGASGSVQTTPEQRLHLDPFRSRAISVLVRGLSTGSVYCTAVIVESPASPVFFTAGAPNASHLVVTPSSFTTERVTGVVNPLGRPTTYTLEWDLQRNPWCVSNGTMGTPQSRFGGNAGSGRTDKPVAGVIGGLTPGKLYCWALVARNDWGASIAFPTVDSTVGAFTAGRPAATTNRATNVTRSRATLHGSFNPSADTNLQYFFVWDRVGSKLCRTGVLPKTSAWKFGFSPLVFVSRQDTRDHNVSARTGRLARRTKYCFKLVVWSSEPSVTTTYFGRMRTFKTAR